jgi:hypothetical protein
MEYPLIQIPKLNKIKKLAGAIPLTSLKTSIVGNEFPMLFGEF